MEDTKELVNEIQSELQSLTSSISEVVDSIHKLTGPISESQKKVPQAALQLEKINVQTEEATHRMIDKTESISKRGDEILSALETLCGELPQDMINDNLIVCSAIQSIKDKLHSNMDDVEVIQNSLQFQDITSQQLSFASTLIDEIEGKLHHLLSVFEGEQTPEKLFSLVQQRVYDPNADNSPSTATQENVDLLIEEFNSRQDK